MKIHELITEAPLDIFVNTPYSLVVNKKKFRTFGSKEKARRALEYMRDRYPNAECFIIWDPYNDPDSKWDAQAQVAESDRVPGDEPNDDPYQEPEPLGDLEDNDMPDDWYGDDFDDDNDDCEGGVCTPRIGVNKKAKPKSKEVPLYRPGGATVVILNDPVTPFQVVIEAVVHATRLSVDEAVRRVNAAHRQGWAAVASYASRDLAETVASNIENHAAHNTNYEHMKRAQRHTGPWPLTCEVLDADDERLPRG